MYSFLYQAFNSSNCTSSFISLMSVKCHEKFKNCTRKVKKAGKPVGQPEVGTIGLKEAKKKSLLYNLQHIVSKHFVVCTTDLACNGITSYRVLI
ncbi:hypothetical protein GUJ93_ZPchr0006g44288 [Zizania palustris]|uniref:Uncharacterized protein n=1 Tax=Zizania palustris TaxID=103762 RepID=A0A8J5TDP6_ZIZPA|nr:hypothetical protein GUJ93_ZPchr0006g44288 [Zizania palustris]